MEEGSRKRLLEIEQVGDIKPFLALLERCACGQVANASALGPAGRGIDPSLWPEKPIDFGLFPPLNRRVSTAPQDPLVGFLGSKFVSRGAALSGRRFPLTKVQG